MFVKTDTGNLPSFASGFEFLMNAENLAKMSIPAVLDSGCLAPSLMYLHTGKHETITGKHTQMYEEVKRIIDETQ